MTTSLDAIWYESHPLSLPLAPLSWLFATGVGVRRLAYRIGALPRHHVPCPVIVVGNISVGGTGKTPLVIWIARYLRQNGFHPGVVCRGYRGRARRWPQQVRPDSDPVVVGEESVLLARRSGCPVAAGPDRSVAAMALLEHTRCDVIISDDGLQHLSLDRNIEIAVIDGVRRHGNGRCLPSGPLREPVSRLAQVDLVVANEGAQPGEFEMQLRPWQAISLVGEDLKRPMESFVGGRVHTVCAIGHPDRFLRMLEALGVRSIPHVFPDHHSFRPDDIAFSDGLPVLMTEKDAIKCRRFAAREHWYIPVRAEIHPGFAARLMSLLDAVNARGDCG